ncbi:class I SAM-dependent methyltransferase [Laspinema sp. A4]|uniref:class I SAM-dependent methyltransferase n=1 Tax=Laspinema sp. D2d TaxID=2953686 RepID=UPI0021BAF2DF|nr:class I SAM-dependent methyltransferase [Laspinema sp. D2d]MCT7983259.1 class I SAM-dependent methyltransferase [Laspinema sp. D2d]
MNPQFRHPILPETTHDELARQNFVTSLKKHVFSLSVKNQGVYETRAKPRFEQEHQRSPETRYEIQQAMKDEPQYRWVSALKRMGQELMWDSVLSSVERQLPALRERAKGVTQPLGSLTLNPDLVIPSYQQAVDIHCMPGSYHSDLDGDDVAAGALYDRGVYLYAQGMLGPLNDDMGRSAVQNFLKREYPDFHPRHILDMGCTVGHSTLPYVEGYPEAAVHGIDIGASLLRYAHARAEALGKRVHFSQQNAEKTNFADQSFDLVVSHILFHEIPVPALRNVLRECYRLLTPGGMMVHIEAPLYRHMDPYRAFAFDWETVNNNEPFWSAFRDLDLKAEATNAGFEPDQVLETFAPNGAWLQAQSNGIPKGQGFGSRGTWFMLVAWK